MSIELVAPKKFHFQDLVCIELALQHWACADIQIFVEPQDGEDARLIFSRDDGSVSRLEVQVKGSAEQVTIETIAACLAHCPRSSSTSLLESLFQKTAGGVLLVMTGRCADQTVPFVVSEHWSASEGNGRRMRIKDAELLITAFKKIQNSPSSKIEKDRFNARVALAGQLNAIVSFFLLPKSSSGRSARRSPLQLRLENA